MTKDYQKLHPWLLLLSVPEIGPVRSVNLVRHFSSPERVIEASEKQLRDVEDVGEVVAKAIKNQIDEKWAREQIKLAQKNQVEWISFLDEEYPDNLKTIFDFPPILFIRGKFVKEDRKALGLVGTRTATTYGKQVAKKISYDLAMKGYTIVSGLARGIDSCGHRAALEAGGRTIAVLGSGLDVIYPPENKKLTEEITQKGVLVSEFPLGTQPEGNNFPKRNRLISGLSLGVIIVEAGSKSGALLTAQCALDQNREVFAVPGNIGSKTSEGANELIKKGAKLVTNVGDILEELQDFNEKKEIPASTLVQLSEEEKKIWEVLSQEPIHIDKIAGNLNFTSQEALSFLLGLELKGLAKQLAGKLFVKSL